MHRTTGDSIGIIPAVIINRAAGFSFADGHAEIKKWRDDRTVPPIVRGFLPFRLRRGIRRLSRETPTSFGCRNAPPERNNITSAPPAAPDATHAPHHAKPSGWREQFRVRPEGLSTVWISIKSRKIAARHLQPDPMPSLEHVAGHPLIDLEPLRLARFQQRWLRPLPVPCRG